MAFDSRRMVGAAGVAADEAEAVEGLSDMRIDKERWRTKREPARTKASDEARRTTQVTTPVK